MILIKFFVVLLLEQNILTLFLLEIENGLIGGSQILIILSVLKLNAQEFSVILLGHVVKLSDIHLLLLLLFVDNLL